MSVQGFGRCLDCWRRGGEYEGRDPGKTDAQGPLDATYPRKGGKAGGKELQEGEEGR